MNTTILPALRSAADLDALQAQWARRETIRWKWDGDHQVWTNAASGKSVTVQGMACLLNITGKSEETAQVLATQHTDLWVDLLDAALAQLDVEARPGKHLAEER